MSYEIEKKFLVDDNASFRKFLEVQPNISRKKIEQAYLVVNSSEEIRIRSVQNLENGTNLFVLTVKSTGDLIRLEEEIVISEESYSQLVDLLDQKKLTFIKKTRWVIPYKEITLEIDFFENEDLGFVILEVEFPSVKGSKLIQLEKEFNFILEDVTSKSKYKNKNLWKQINSL